MMWQLPSKLTLSRISLPTAFISVILIWSTTPLAIKWSVAEVSVSFALFLRMAIGTVLCWMLLKFLRQTFPFHRKAIQTYCVGACSLFGAMILTYWAAQYVNSGLISVLYGLSPLITSFAAAYFLQEKSLTSAKIFGMICGFLGLIFIFQSSLHWNSNVMLGCITLFLAVVIQSFGLVLLKKIGDTSSPVAINLGILAFSLPLFFLAWFLTDRSLPTSLWNRAGISIFYLSFFGSVLGFVLYYFMIKNLKTGTISLIYLMTPVIALLLGKHLNDESILLYTWIGTACILLGLTAHQSHHLKNLVKSIRAR
ncbi:MAG: DMT family transporter [Pseudomonadota bacterium]